MASEDRQSNSTPAALHDDFEKYTRNLDSHTTTEVVQEPTLSLLEEIHPSPRRKNLNNTVLKLSNPSPEQLEAKLLDELAADERYQLINDAKLRALSQGTSSYEEFR
jgi:hypothetical protein